MLVDEKPPLTEDLLQHFGVKGMRWGQRKNDYPGASKRTNKEASKDAHEFARAKMFTGEGAGNRRKLIKATVQGKAKKDPTYQKAFDHHLERQDMANHVAKARKERSRKDKRNSAGRTARGLNRAFNGPFAPTVAVTGIVAGLGYMRANNLDTKVMRAGARFVNQARYGTPIDLGFLK